MILAARPSYPPCPYMVKSFFSESKGKLLLSFVCSIKDSGTTKILQIMTLQYLIYGNFGSLCFYLGNASTMDFSATTNVQGIIFGIPS